MSLFSGETIDPGTNPSDRALYVASLREELLELYKSMEEIYRNTRRAKLVEDFLEAYNTATEPFDPSTGSGRTVRSDHGEPFDSPFVLRFSKDERFAQDRLVEPQAQGDRMFVRIREQLGPISRATLYGWRQAYREGGIDALIPASRPRKVTRAERRVLLEILMDGVGIGRAIFVCKYFLKRKGTPSPSSPATLRRYATKLIRGKENA